MRQPGSPALQREGMMLYGRLQGLTAERFAELQQQITAASAIGDDPTMAELQTELEWARARLAELDERVR